MSKSKSKKSKKSKSKSKKSKKDKPKTQTDFIISWLNDEIEADKIEEKLAERFDKDSKWAKSRLKTYERAYGKKGKKDDRVSVS